MKKFAFLACAGVVSVLLFSGCSGVKELSSALSEATNVDGIASQGLRITKNKTTQSEVFKSIGAPGLVFKNESGGESWVYPRVAVRQSDLEFQVKGNFAAIFPYSTGSIAQGGGVAGVKSSSRIESSRSSYKTAGLLIKFNGIGCVSSYEFTSTSF